MCECVGAWTFSVFTWICSPVSDYTCYVRLQLLTPPFSPLPPGHIVLGESYFDIDRETGELYVNVTLDRESIAEFTLKIKVGDMYKC